MALLCNIIWLFGIVKFFPRGEMHFCKELRCACPLPNTDTIDYPLSDIYNNYLVNIFFSYSTEFFPSCFPIFPDASGEGEGVANSGTTREGRVGGEKFFLPML